MIPIADWQGASNGCCTREPHRSGQSAGERVQVQQDSYKPGALCVLVLIHCTPLQLHVALNETECGIFSPLLATIIYEVLPRCMQ